MRTVLLLTLSNIFMTYAWYGHLRFKSAPLMIAILASWGIAFFEYCLQVPANRWGHEQFSAPQLKVLQEVITLTVFAVFSVLYLHEKLRWNEWAGFGLILAAVVVTFAFGPPRTNAATAASAEDRGTPSPTVSSTLEESFDE